jgi:hypothetical protein
MATNTALKDMFNILPCILGNVIQNDDKKLLAFSRQSI